VSEWYVEVSEIICVGTLLSSKHTIHDTALDTSLAPHKPITYHAIQRGLSNLWPVQGWCQSVRYSTGRIGLPPTHHFRYHHLAQPDELKHALHCTALQPHLTPSYHAAHHPSIPPYHNQHVISHHMTGPTHMICKSATNALFNHCPHQLSLMTRLVDGIFSNPLT
jgi:hypothetical protein